MLVASVMMGATPAVATLRTTHSPVSTTTTTIDPGTLAWNDVRPSAATDTGTRLYDTVVTLFNAIVSGSTKQADTVFFPQRAFFKLKAFYNPNIYYLYDLLSGFNLDVGAYHRYLRAAGVPRFVAALDQPSAVTWISPGACYNNLGYWHIGGVRIVYAYRTKVESVAIFSMISWRGVWYVVHLGAFTHPTKVGVVGAPSAGPGTPWSAGGC